MSTSFTRGGRSEETNYLPIGTVFEVLSDERRRHLLYYLIDEAGGKASAADAADHIAAVDPGDAGMDRETVLVELHHRHLPQMESAGLVEYDGRAGSVRYLEDPLVEECLARVVARDFGGQP